MIIKIDLESSYVTLYWQQQKQLMFNLINCKCCLNVPWTVVCVERSRTRLLAINFILNKFLIYLNIRLLLTLLLSLYLFITCSQAPLSLLCGRMWRCRISPIMASSRSVWHCIRTATSSSCTINCPRLSTTSRTVSIRSRSDFRMPTSLTRCSTVSSIYSIYKMKSLHIYHH